MTQLVVGFNREKAVIQSTCMYDTMAKTHTDMRESDDYERNILGGLLLKETGTVPAVHWEYHNSIDAERFSKNKKQKLTYFEGGHDAQNLYKQALQVLHHD